MARVAVGCTSTAASGGNCGKGALSAAFEIAAQPVMIKFQSFGQWGGAPEAAEAGLIGGEAARIAGGRFEDGFSTAAVQYLATSTSPQQENAASSSVSDLVGKVWNLPNTIIGLVYGGPGDLAGWIGYAAGWWGEAPGIQLGNNGFQFTNNPFAYAGAITLGNMEIYGGLQPGDPSPESAFHTTEMHEDQHTYQGQMLGPLYVPLAALGLGVGLIFNGNSHGPASFLERGPQQDPPTPW